LLVLFNNKQDLISTTYYAYYVCEQQSIKIIMLDLFQRIVSILKPA